MKTIAIAIAAAVLAAAPIDAREEGIRLTFGGGRVSVAAADALASDLLKVWARQGAVEVVGLELLGSRRVTLALEEADEKDALMQIVGDATAFVALWKERPAPAASRFARIALGDPQTLVPQPVAETWVDPEARYTYYQSPKQTGPDLGPTVAAPAAGAPVPERVYDYHVPAKANGPVLPMGEPRVEPSPIDPEARFKYYVPGKIRK
jgi:HAMP domain-containing protein